MAHATPLITTLVSGLCLAFIFGAIANRLRISPLVGYLLAGVIAGPHTPGFHADVSLANELAEIGVILLMFGVGLHFSMKDLLSVKAIALPGAIAQMAVATLLGMGLGFAMGWSLGASIVFGLALSTASTVVLLRAMQQRRLIETERGRIAVGWLIVEDLAMVLALVLLPALAGVLGGEVQTSSDPLIAWLNPNIWGIIGITLAKVGLFILLMMVVGRRVIPWALKISAQTGSRELFRLAVLAIALGVAFGAAQLFGVSLALGAFFAGMIMSESELSHRAAEETLPLRDAFAVLFFVSVGMLFDPLKLLDDFIPLFATLFIIIIGKSAAAYFIVRLFRRSNGTALTISASLAQIGEFSFILAALGKSLGLIDENVRDLILGGAIISILVNPLIFIIAEKIKNRLDKSSPANSEVTEIAEKMDVDEPLKSNKSDHLILIGYGDVGQRVANDNQTKNKQVVIIEDAIRLAEKARSNMFETFIGNGVDKEVLDSANIEAAKELILAMHNTFEAGQIITNAQSLNKDLFIIAHALSDAEAQYLKDLGANIVVTDAEEIANGIITHLLKDVTDDSSMVTDVSGDENRIYEMNVERPKA
ncbi:Kef family K(+) transporter [Bartonella sp. HY329]|uniref:YbaL family putative K(+) efflux transporter n=1 Tax=unclassified Bartonella TaxID=2645622 RepID=UPI0021C9A46E|nr:MULTISPECIES: YbaL family putative K(+) efflux transporter [unclassified Bartonella]UXM94353.1 Kef family K(+) transporter [Bartonella sp. HY329]UXN08676.1 Kef family K(+) transporter [Bartonella sp. HY328]